MTLYVGDFYVMYVGSFNVTLYVGDFYVTLYVGGF